MTTNERLVLYDTCKLTKGIGRSIIVDFQRKAYYFIPNELARFIDNYGIIDISSSSHFAPEERFINFLLKEEIAFIQLQDEMWQFPKTSHEDWLYPAHISNAIIERIKYEPDLLSIINGLVEIQLCNYIEFRFLQPLLIPELKYVIKQINQTDLNAYSLCVQIEEPFDDNALIELLSFAPKLFRTTIYNSSTNRSIKPHEISNFGNLFFINSPNINHSCGVVNRSYFSINTDLYLESFQHNTCLNRKIAIDANGDIKNCPSMTKSYGNIRDTTLAEAIEKPGFKDAWYIHKDQISVCKDCEFRHICTDCRAYLEDPQDKYSKPLKCGYDPYTCTWEEWSTNPLKQQAIEYYGMQELVKK
jgi:SPASM domain peptide maturase of grasp-with-spasm system